MNDDRIAELEIERRRINAAERRGEMTKDEAADRRAAIRVEAARIWEDR